MDTPAPEPPPLPPIPPATRAAIEAAVGIAEAVQAFRVDVGDLKTTAKRNRHLIRLLGLSLAFDVALSVGLGGVAIDARRAAHAAGTATTAAAQAAQRDRATCESSNAARRANRDLWNYLFSFPAPPNETPEAAEQRVQETAQFNAYLDRVTVQRDCSVKP